MADKKCINCVWKGELSEGAKFCPVCGDFLVENLDPVEEKEEVVKDPLDINDDGKFDKEDVKLARKVVYRDRKNKKGRG